MPALSEDPVFEALCGVWLSLCVFFLGLIFSHSPKTCALSWVSGNCKLQATSLWALQETGNLSRLIHPFLQTYVFHRLSGFFWLKELRFKWVILEHFRGSSLENNLLSWDSKHTAKKTMIPRSSLAFSIALAAAFARQRCHIPKLLLVNRRWSHCSTCGEYMRSPQTITFAFSMSG